MAKKIKLNYETACQYKWTDTYATLDEAAKGARNQLGRWCGNYHVLIGEFGDCKLYHVDGATIEELENKMKEVA